MKICNRCNKNLDDYLFINGKGQTIDYCKICKNDEYKKYYADNKCEHNTLHNKCNICSLKSYAAPIKRKTRNDYISRN